jgi:hypothetical protein
LAKVVLIRDSTAHHKIHWHWVKGHAGHTGNERCEARSNDGSAIRVGCGDTQDETRCRDDSVVRSQHHCAQQSNSVAEVSLVVSFHSNDITPHAQIID